MKGYLISIMRIDYQRPIGNVLCIVEGAHREFMILYKIFHDILGYQYESIRRSKGFSYKKYSSPENKHSRVCVINAKESNIGSIARDDEFLNDLFLELIEKYDFPVHRSAIYYIWDRDPLSNTDTGFIENQLHILQNAQDNGINMQGLLLLSYPSIEAYWAQCFLPECFHCELCK